MTTPNEGRAHFPATRWSLVARASTREAGSAREALRELCGRYWYPVYAYARRSGHAPTAAFALAAAYFEHLSERELPNRDGAVRFREFLLDALNRFLAEDWRTVAPGETGDGVAAPAPLEVLEQRYRDENTESRTPEQAFERSFALQILSNALERLRTEAVQAGRAELFAQLEPYLAAEPAPGVYQQLSETLSLRPLALVMAVKRLRERYRELAELELAETVGSAPDLERERAALRAVLGVAEPAS